MKYKSNFVKTKIVDIVTSNNKGYFYDMPVASSSMKSYTTHIANSFVFNIANEKID